MDVQEEVFNQFRELGSSITESSYVDGIRQGYELLVSMHDLGIGKDDVYQLLSEYHNSLEDALLHEWTADIMDFVVGWCAPQNDIWRED